MSKMTEQSGGVMRSAALSDAERQQMMERAKRAYALEQEAKLAWGNGIGRNDIVDEKEKKDAEPMKRLEELKSKYINATNDFKDINKTQNKIGYLGIVKIEELESNMEHYRAIVNPTAKEAIEAVTKESVSNYVHAGFENFVEMIKNATKKPLLDQSSETYAKYANLF